MTMPVDNRPLPKAVQIAECGGPCESQGPDACDCGFRDAAQLERLLNERDTAVQAGLLLAERLHRADAGLAASRAAIAALRAERSGQQEAVVRVLVALGICAAISILWH
jgi:hypothetical protein